MSDSNERQRQRRHFGDDQKAPIVRRHLADKVPVGRRGAVRRTGRMLAWQLSDARLPHSLLDAFPPFLIVDFVLFRLLGFAPQGFGFLLSAGRPIATPLRVGQGHLMFSVVMLLACLAVHLVGEAFKVTMLLVELA